MYMTKYSRFGLLNATVLQLDYNLVTFLFKYTTRYGGGGGGGGVGVLLLAVPY